MRTIVIVAVVLILNCRADSGHAQSPLCLPYEPEIVVLTGSVQRALAYGPSDYGGTQRKWTSSARRPLASTSGDRFGIADPRDARRATSATHNLASALIETTSSTGARSNQLINAWAQTAPAIWATMKPGKSTGRMPENVSVSDRAIATAGLANDVDAVNQYAAVM